MRNLILIIWYFLYLMNTLFEWLCIFVVHCNYILSTNKYFILIIFYYIWKLFAKIKKIISNFFPNLIGRIFKRIFKFISFYWRLINWLYLIINILMNWWLVEIGWLWFWVKSSQKGKNFFIFCWVHFNILCPFKHISKWAESF